VQHSDYAIVEWCAVARDAGVLAELDAIVGLDRVIHHMQEQCERNTVGVAPHSSVEPCKDATTNTCGMSRVARR